jgi:altronate hydrolase
VASGDHVHLHNLAYKEFDRDYDFCVEAKQEPVLPLAERATFQGYVRSDGKVGTRNVLDVASGERTTSEDLGYGDKEFVPRLVGTVM